MGLLVLGKLSVFVIIQCEEIDVPPLFLAVEVFAPKQSCFSIIRVPQTSWSEAWTMDLSTIVSHVISNKYNYIQTRTNIEPQASGSEKLISPL